MKGKREEKDKKENKKQFLKDKLTFKYLFYFLKQFSMRKKKLHNSLQSYMKKDVSIWNMF